MRFKEYKDDWIIDDIGNVISIDCPKYNPLKGKNIYPCIELDNLDQETGILLNTYNSKNQNSIKNKFEKENILYGKLRPYLKKYFYPNFEGVCSTEIWVMKSIKLLPKWIYYFVQTDYFSNLTNISSGSKMPRADWNYIKNELIYYPKNSQEAMKIADMLETIDKRIQTQIKIIEDYEELKSWITDQIFNREVSTKKLKSLIFEVNQRNKLQLALDVLTVSNKRGFIKQSEQFEERNVASEDTSNYKIVCVDQYAYNPARINVGSIARLNNYEKGIISPMYTCFEINEEKLNPIYFDLFLKSKSFKSQLNKKLEGSVRQCLIFSGMLSMEIPLPSIQTQSVIAKRISMLDSNIKIENTYLVRLKQQKKYLLDNLFI